MDAVSGATYTSKAVVEAVEKAVSGAGEPEEQRQLSPSPGVGDGVHRGSAEGLAAPVLDVTVEGGKITAIEIVETSERRLSLIA